MTKTKTMKPKDIATLVTLVVVDMTLNLAVLVVVVAVVKFVWTNI